MNNLDDIAQKNNYKGIAISIAIHIIILLLFLWVTVWQEPYPPNPEYGIELNFGTSNNGSGQEAVAAEESLEEVQEDVNEEATKEAIDEETSAPESELPEQQEDVSESSSEVTESANSTATQETGPVEQKEQEIVKPTEEKKIEEKAVVPPAKEVKEEVKQAPKTNPNAIFPGKSNSQGETSESGDQGVKNGTTDAKAMMGPQGGGSGSRLDMSGWAWDSPPRPKDNSDQNGQIVFRIKVDDNGEVINVEVLETTVSPDIVRVYQSEVEKITFYKTSAGKTLDSYTGKITFLIRSR